ncbi:hypothetical protein D3C87_1530690 [compost metagenome]
MSEVPVFVAVALCVATNPSTGPRAFSPCTTMGSRIVAPTALALDEEFCGLIRRTVFAVVNRKVRPVPARRRLSAPSAERFPAVPTLRRFAGRGPSKATSIPVTDEKRTSAADRG